MEVAIFSDCRTLVENFVRSGSAAFQCFCQEWRALMFHHMYSAQSTTIELLQTTGALFHVARRVASGRCPNASIGDGKDKLLRRVGGLYLLYAVYFKQPTERYVKIDLSLETWQLLQALIQSLPRGSEWDDARYTFWRLYEAQAFRFTALDYCVGLEDLVDYDQLAEEQLVADGHVTERQTKLHKELQGFDETRRIVPALAVLEDGYNEMKEVLGSSAGLSAQALPPTSIFKDIKTAFQRIEEIIKDKQLSEHGKPRQPGECDKSNLKRKGYKVTHSAQDIEIDNTTVDSTSDPKVARRMSARTIFAQPLPKDMLVDLEDEARDSGSSDDSDESDEENASDEGTMDHGAASDTEARDIDFLLM